jgi:hypothetical protein
MLLSSEVHSSAISLQHRLLPEVMAVFDGWHLTMRVIGGIAKFQKITFTPEEQVTYEQALKPRW